MAETSPVDQVVAGHELGRIQTVVGTFRGLAGEKPERLRMGSVITVATITKSDLSNVARSRSHVGRSKCTPRRSSWIDFSF
jgi:hypothetical protein